MCNYLQREIKQKRKWTKMKADLHVIHGVSQLFKLMGWWQRLKSNIGQFHVLFMQLLLQFQHGLLVAGWPPHQPVCTTPVSLICYSAICHSIMLQLNGEIALPGISTVRLTLWTSEKRWKLISQTSFNIHCWSIFILQFCFYWSVRSRRKKNQTDTYCKILLLLLLLLILISQFFRSYSRLDQVP